MATVQIVNGKAVVSTGSNQALNDDSAGASTPFDNLTLAQAKAYVEANVNAATVVVLKSSLKQLLSLIFILKRRQQIQEDRLDALIAQIKELRK